MTIRFNEIEEKVYENFKGGAKHCDVRAFSDGKNKIMRLRLVPGASIGMHTHETDCEIFYVLRGNGHVIMDGVKEPICEGECHYCPKGHSHSLINDSDSDIELFAIVSQQ